jgi:hypothetical protein
MEEAPENGKESSHSEHANGINVLMQIFCVMTSLRNYELSTRISGKVSRCI